MDKPRFPPFRIWRSPVNRALRAGTTRRAITGALLVAFLGALWFSGLLPLAATIEGPAVFDGDNIFSDFMRQVFGSFAVIIWFLLSRLVVILCVLMVAIVRARGAFSPERAAQNMEQLVLLPLRRTELVLTRMLRGFVLPAAILLAALMLDLMTVWLIADEDAFGVSVLIVVVPMLLIAMPVTLIYATAFRASMLSRSTIGFVARMFLWGFIWLLLEAAWLVALVLSTENWNWLARIGSGTICWGFLALQLLMILWLAARSVRGFHRAAVRD
jgi:hypothetical protein